MEASHSIKQPILLNILLAALFPPYLLYWFFVTRPKLAQGINPEKTSLTGVLNDWRWQFGLRPYHGLSFLFGLVGLAAIIGLYVALRISAITNCLEGLCGALTIFYIKGGLVTLTLAGYLTLLAYWGSLLRAYNQYVKTTQPGVEQPQAQTRWPLYLAVAGMIVIYAGLAFADQGRQTEVVKETTPENVLIPTYQPAGYKLFSRSVNDEPFTGKPVVDLRYESDDGFYKVLVLESPSVYNPPENCGGPTANGYSDQKGCQFYAKTNSGSIYADPDFGGYTYKTGDTEGILDGQLPKEEIIKVFESMQPAEEHPAEQRTGNSWAESARFWLGLN
ncbi:MAG: hypothetical protein Q8Q11_00555 [bacterium]|nr:hypothetical protein [bacterium]MDZ4248442.1 hypothetical protein [Patescibacteria group bacterium]